MDFSCPTYAFVIFISNFSLSTTFSLQRKISIEKTDIYFFPINDTLFDFTKHVKLFLRLKFIKKMEKLLSLLEKPEPEAIIDEKKLKYFISKIPVLGYFSITERDYKSSSVEVKTSLLNRYYKELYQNNYGSGNFYLFVFLCGCLLSAVSCLDLVLIMLLILSFE